MNLTQILENIVNTTLNSFDFTYCLLVNILTYCVIHLIEDFRNKAIKTWVKRVMLLVCILLTGVLYWAMDKNIELIINSSILATVSWDIIFKPICKKLGIDYQKIDDTVTK